LMIRINHKLLVCQNIVSNDELPIPNHRTSSHVLINDV
jgi:hypothetical protein